MNYNENILTLILVILVLSLITAALRVLPLFVKIPENNPKVNKFFEALPYTILTLLVFPDIFTSTGNTGFDVFRVLVGMGIVAFLALRKMNLGVIIIVSISVIFLFDIGRGLFLK